MQKIPLPVDVRRSKTSLLKLPLVSPSHHAYPLRVALIKDDRA